MLLEAEWCLRKGQSIDECCRDPNLNNIFSQVKVYFSNASPSEAYVNLYV